ncbi:tetratricopeptide repeat protein, partial [Marichromatium sp. AB31]|uniref:tetratricopeptide repeat protein n=1 Tax=Marichromatium sp. AB31 TaxID=2483362 RepID=UPI0011CE4CB6
MNGDDNLYEIALGHYRDGRIEVAEPIYRAVLEVDPDHFSALFDLASIAKLKGNLDASAELIRKALRLKPLDLNALALLIDVLLAKGHHKDAGLVLSEVRAMEDGAGVFAQLCKRLGIDQESFSDVNRGVEVKEALATTETPRISTADASEIKGLIEVKRFDEALAKARDLCDRFPRDPFLWKAMGTALFHSGKYQAALTVIQQALAIDSVDSELLNTLGNILVELGRYSQAERCFRRAIEISPYYAEAYNSLGVVLKSLGKLDESIVCCKQALSLKPGLSEAYSNIGVVCKERGHLHQALAYYQNALAKDPGNCNAKNNIAGIFQDLGRHDEALRYYSLALKDKPQFAVAESNQLFTINYHPDWSGQDIFSAYLDYDIRYWQSLRVNWRSHSNGREPERRLRLGYVSPDFFSHAIRYMLEPLLECHDHERFEVFAYAQLVREDAQTARYRSLVDHWVPTRGLSDVQLAERIRADGIDILVDLAGHTANNRLGAFARKPAPVSVSLWVGYGYTSGLSAIDYFLCDEVLVPEGAEELFSERPWRIAAPAGMYRPSEGMGAVNVLPALERGYI